LPDDVRTIYAVLMTGLDSSDPYTRIRHLYPNQPLASACTADPQQTMGDKKAETVRRGRVDDEDEVELKGRGRLDVGS